MTENSGLIPPEEWVERETETPPERRVGGKPWKAPRLQLLAPVDQTQSGGGTRSDGSIWGGRPS